MISVRLPIQILPTCQLVDGKFLLCQLLHPVPGLVDPSARLRLFGLLQTPDIQFGPLPPTVFWIQLLVNCLRLVGVWWASSVSAMPALALPQRVPLSPLKIFLPKTVTLIGPPIGTVALAIPQAVAFLNGHAPTVLSKWWLLMLTQCAIDGMLIAPVSMIFHEGDGNPGMQAPLPILEDVSSLDEKQIFWKCPFWEVGISSSTRSRVSLKAIYKARSAHRSKRHSKVSLKS